MYFDSHVHLDVRSNNDLELMALAGVTKALTLAHDFLATITSAKTLIDHFNHLLAHEKGRGRRYGLQVYVGLAVHPRAITVDVAEALNAVAALAKRDDVVAIGEAGLENPGNSIEIEVLKKQVQLAVELGKPIIIHTPSRGKDKAVDKILGLLDYLKPDPNLILVDHLDSATVEKVLDKGYYAGLTVQPPKKLTAKEVAEIVSKLTDGVDRVLVSSDLARGGGEPLALPRTALAMRELGVEEKTIRMVLHDNACKLFHV